MYFTGFLFLSLWLVSCRGKALKSMENTATDVLRTTDGTTDGIEQGRDITQREVTGIKSRFEQQRYHKRKGDEHLPNKIPILEGSKRSCFCPFSASCPDGFVRTYPQWPCLHGKSNGFKWYSDATIQFWRWITLVARKLWW